MNKNILFIGMDVHKDSIEIAIAEGTSQEVRRFGKISGTRDALRKTLRKLVSGKRYIFAMKPDLVATSFIAICTAKAMTVGWWPRP